MADNEKWNDADEYNEKGIQAYNKGNLQEAEKYYKLAIEKNPYYKYAYYNLGLVYQDYNKLEEAIQWYQKAIDVDEKYADAYNGIGSCYYTMGQYKKAREFYFKTIEYDENSKYPYYNLGLIAEKEKDYQKAKEYYHKALKIDPNYARAYNSLGIVYYNEENFEEALKYYHKAIECDSRLIYPYYNIGLVYERKKEWKEAKKWYLKTLQINPNYEPALEGLDYIKKEVGDISIDEKDIKIESEKEQTFLEKYGRNLTKMAQEGKLFDSVGRDKEIQSILEILYKRIKNNPILVGHPGVGKTAIVEGLAKRIVEKRTPEFFWNKEIIEFNVGSLIAGTTYRGQLEQKIKTLIDEVGERKDKVIIFLDEIHTIIGAGRVEGGNLDIAQMLKPVLARGDFPCIGATTHEEYRKYFEQDKALERRFYPVRIDELSPEATLQVLHYLKPKIEQHYKITLSDAILKDIVDLSHKYLKKRYFPDKAIDTLEKTASHCVLNGKKTIEKKDILEVIGETTGIVFVETEANQEERLMQLEDYLKTQIMGQDDAISRVSSLVRLTKRRLDLKPERPDGVFLFTGPSGVGKTELAKQLALFLYGSDKKLIRIDMTEFSEPHSVSKILGSPPGYVGHDEETYLTQKIEENPSCVLVLDEIEKAHPEVIKIFLQVFDEGKMKDAKGKTIIFSDTIIIMTSNYVTETKKGIGFEENKEVLAQNTIKKLSEFFPVEFLNRVDEIILFNHLSPENVRSIVENKILTKTRQSLEQKGYRVEFQKSLIDAVIERGYSREFGARNLERTFEKLVLMPLSDFLYKEKPPIHSTIMGDFKQQRVYFSLV